MSKEIEENGVKLECPECEKDTFLKVDGSVCCTNCDESFKGIAFKRKKILSGTAAMFIIASAIGGMKLERELDDDRLPYAYEYKLMDSCIGTKSRLMDKEAYQKRVDLCSCAISKAVNSLDDIKDGNDTQDTMNIFVNEIKAASREC